MYARAMHNKHIKHDGVISNVNFDDGRRRAGILIPRHRFRGGRVTASDTSSSSAAAGQCRVQAAVGACSNQTLDVLTGMHCKAHPCIINNGGPPAGQTNSPIMKVYVRACVIIRALCGFHHALSQQMHIHSHAHAVQRVPNKLEPKVLPMGSHRVCDRR